MTILKKIALCTGIMGSALVHAQPSPNTPLLEIFRQLPTALVCQSLTRDIVIVYYIQSLNGILGLGSEFQDQVYYADVIPNVGEHLVYNSITGAFVLKRQFGAVSYTTDCENVGLDVLRKAGRTIQLF
ncbi:MAG: hypothetical protein MI750_07630 [Xanthomonadales bacterium]|nr:hypothetical protein [Xanthomonadales bacterium]